MLGPVELLRSGHALPLGAPKQRTLLALLLARAGSVVPLGEVVAELWGERPPVSAVANARMYASNLRRLIAASVDGPVLARLGDGYRLTWAPRTWI